jgi:hypothetical protein
MTLAAANQALPHVMPNCLNGRIALLVIRRMAAHGVNDARAAQVMFQAFGAHFPRPLVLMRAMMADIAASAATSITVAPCCCPRATAAEIGLLHILEGAEQSPAKARLLLADLLGNRSVDGTLASVAAVSAAFADFGRPIRTFD